MKKYDIKRSSFYKFTKQYEEAKKGKYNEQRMMIQGVPNEA
ncbi:hypothetical protein [Bacillus sp. SRB1LM]|nr:hypothetical protein [Bacillus sp. SRB1LM]